ncbi:MAG: bifunctional metallophosphatase/5'-nucleotidase [Elusimicrobiales bacterium]|nr:bifunctional metallophosphatase/5'-nucleotidase [Elusimicrobiales bacterium]
MKTKNYIYLLLFVSIYLVNFLYAEKISIYHTSDVHGMYSSRKAKWDNENSTRSIGGFPALMSLVKKDPNKYILLDSGDMFQGSPEGNITKGMATVEFMNMLGYSAAVVGNHDYDFGEENLKKLIKSAKFPFLGANIYYLKDEKTDNETKDKNVDYLKPYTIINISKRNIAILGIAGQHTKTSTLPSNVKHLKFKDEARETKKWMEEIRKLNPDAVIILAHIGIDPNLSQKIIDVSTYTFTHTRNTTIQIAKAAQNANLILGGHNHTGLINGWKEPETNTMICESYWGLTHVTKAEIEFDDSTGKVKNVSCKLIPLWVDETGEDKTAIKKWEEIYSSVSKEMDKIIGKAKKALTFDSQTFDNAIGNFVTDITRLKANTEIAFQNAGGVRNIINEGDIKIRDIYQVMPFENTIVVLKMKGEDIYEVIKDNLKINKTSMYISGIKVKYKIKDDKVEILEILLENGDKIEPQKIYTVATNNYLTSGGSGGKAFKNAIEKTDTMILVRDALIEWIKKNKEIKEWETGRFIRVE